MNRSIPFEEHLISTKNLRMLDINHYPIHAIPQAHHNISLSVCVLCLPRPLFLPATLSQPTDLLPRCTWYHLPVLDKPLWLRPIVVPGFVFLHICLKRRSSAHGQGCLYYYSLLQHSTCHANSSIWKLEWKEHSSLWSLFPLIYTGRHMSLFPVPTYVTHHRAYAAVYRPVPNSKTIHRSSDTKK